jgi:indolepyruvate ferredoxin oxidoreductase alpha subunit
LQRKIVSGNEALALGALRAGARVITGYPGTPSSEVIGFLLGRPPEGVHVEWSTNEKVALEIAAGAAWAGQRSLCTMKMSGLNVAYDSLISIAYSGVNGGMVVYVADDPGVSAGMAEQDSRGFALMADLPMLEPATPAETYRLTQLAFELSERTGSPVFLRLVTSVAHSHASLEVEETSLPPPERPLLLERNIQRYTKAGAQICMAQHRDLISRLEKAEEIIRDLGLNRLHLAASRGELGIVTYGATSSYLEESLGHLAPLGVDRENLSVLRLSVANPLPRQEISRLFGNCSTVLVLEELEPYIEKAIIVEAHRLAFNGKIFGKLEGPLSRIGEVGVRQVMEGIAFALGLTLPENLLRGLSAEAHAAARPITVCAGCPHRGTYLALNRAIRQLKLKKDEVMVTGDIGCTILGMNPPFHTVWNEVSMGASLGIAQGYVHAGLKTPVVATIGDSTFFHAGMPALLNAVQHQTPLTLIILDNGWTAMTGMQANPGTAEAFQGIGARRVDLAHIVRAMGVEQLFQVDPYDLKATTEALLTALPLPGVKVVLARRECAIQSRRRGVRKTKMQVLEEKCTFCKLCITTTGCPALSVGEKTVIIDPAVCVACSLCAQVCPQKAIEKEEMA